MNKMSERRYSQALIDFKDISQASKIKIYILIKNIIKMDEAEKNYLKARNVVDTLRANISEHDLELADEYADAILNAWDSMDVGNFVLNVLFKESE